MSTDQTMQLVYLILLGTALGGIFLVSNRQSLGKTAQQAVTWGLIFVGVIGAYGMWEDLGRQVSGAARVTAENRIEIPQSFDGHYRLALEVNGTSLPFIVDTGASQVVLNRADAARVGIDVEALRFDGVAFTANGQVATASVRLDSLAFGPFRDEAVPAVVSAGEMDGSLLGMSYLQRYDRIEISDGRMVLVR